MELTILERLLLLQSLPEKGSFVTLKLVRELRENLSFSADEVKKYKIKEENGMASWSDVTYTKNIKLNDVTTEVIKNSLKELDKTEQLSEQHFSLCEKFLQ